MAGKEGTGKGLDRVIHLFASGAGKPAVAKKTVPAPVRSAKGCCLISVGGGIAGTFYACNLGICLAERGLNFALLDLETRLPTAAYLFGNLAEEIRIADIAHPNTPPWDDIHELCDENHIIIDGRIAVRLISPNSKGAERLASGAIEPDAIKPFTSLIKDLDFTLVNLPVTLIDNGIAGILPVRKFLLITHPGLESIMLTYELIKSIVEKIPDSLFGFLTHRSNDPVEVRSAFTSLARSVRSNLGKDLRFMGQFPEDPSIGESILSRHPIAAEPSALELRRRFESIAGYIISWGRPLKQNSDSIRAVAS